MSGRGGAAQAWAFFLAHLVEAAGASKGRWTLEARIFRD